MMPRLATLLVLALAWPVGAVAGEPPGVVSHIKILSDKIEDVSSIEAWKQSFIKPGMSDEQKAMAIWESAVKFRHQEQPPNEYLFADGHVHDPIKTFNVYGYGQCCCVSSNIEALARSVGLQARGWGIINHSVPELRWNDSWHMLDASLMTYFPKADGQPAGVEEIVGGVMDWYAQHPEFKGDDGKLGAFMRNGGWRNGPAVLAKCPFYDNNGWFMAATHGWYSTMGEYADKSKVFLYEYGYLLGYQVNVQLRRGERLERNWSNRGLHVNQRENGECYVAGIKVGADQLRYAPKYGDLAPGRVGNGTLSYEPPLADGGVRAGALQAANLIGRDEDGGKGAALHLKDASIPGVLVLRMPTSYAYLGGDLSFTATVGDQGGVRVEFSGNNGLDWKEIAQCAVSGDQRVDLKPLIHRRYDYRLRFTLSGAGTGLERLRIAHDVQHSQRALPALGQGENTISFSAEPQEGTITVECSINGDHPEKNLQLADVHPLLDHLPGKGVLRIDGAAGSLTIPVTTPGDLLRVRFGCHYRARDAADGWDLQISFDDGKSFATVARAPGGVAGNCTYVTADQVPKGTRRALVLFAGTQKNTTCLFDMRIDADYLEPHGGFAPIQVTYVWEEGGVEKREVQVAGKADEIWKIQCAQKPTMKSVIVERLK